MSDIKFKKITEDRYHEWLEVLFPRAWDGGKFLVGEPYDHNAEGYARYQMCAEAGGKHYASVRAVTVQEYREINEGFVLSHIITE